MQIIVSGVFEGSPQRLQAATFGCWTMKMLSVATLMKFVIPTASGQKGFFSETAVITLICHNFS